MHVLVAPPNACEDPAEQGHQSNHVCWHRLEGGPVPNTFGGFQDPVIWY